MAVPKTINEDGQVRGAIDTTYQTLQKDLFTSGLAAEIGVYAFAVLSAIKAHADFQTGDCWPGIRKIASLIGCSKSVVEAAILKLESEHLLRVDRRRKVNHYVARERLDVRVGGRVICTVVVDYVPASMRERLAQLRRAAAGDLEGEDVWARVEVLPGPGMAFDEQRGAFSGRLLADEVPAAAAAEHRARLQTIAQEMRSGSRSNVLKK